jgi:hypothetical protein
MKYVKMLGLAAVAAAALMAFVGASSASATVLCKVEGTGTPTGTTCPAEKAYPAGTEIHAVNTSTAILEGEPFNIECKKSTVKGKTNNEGSATETVSGPIEVLTFEECGTSTVTVLKKGTLEIHWINPVDEGGKETGSHDGTLTASGQEVTTETSTIFGKVHCIFVTQNADLGTLKGGNPASFTANAIISKISTNALCPEPGRWTASYEVTTPKPLFVAGHT